MHFTKDNPKSQYACHLWYNTSHMDNLIVGAGLSGCVLARRLAQAGQNVTIIDQRDRVGGNCADAQIDGITVHLYGAHIFHTSNAQVWQFLSRFTDWHDYRHRVLAAVGDQLIPLPFSFASIRQCFAPEHTNLLISKLRTTFGDDAHVPLSQLQATTDTDLRQLADFIFKNIFCDYTRKQWQCDWQQLDASVTSRVPIVTNDSVDYFADVHQGIPARGYTHLCEQLLQHTNIRLQLQTDFLSFRSQAKTAFGRIFYTGALDELFEFCYGPLPYRSLRFQQEKIARDFFQPVAVVNYPPLQFKFTRIIEHKYFLSEKCAHTIVTREFPQNFIAGQTEPYYPITNATNNTLYHKYLCLAHQKNIVPLGRLGDYRYYNMDQAVSRALSIDINL